MYRRPITPPGEYRDLTQTAHGAYEDLRPRHRPVATSALVALIVLAFLAQKLLPGLEEALAVGPEALRGEPWLIVTGALMHGNAVHLAANAYFGWKVGSHVERSIGALRLLVITAVAMVGSGLAVALTVHRAVGFSGVLFGWLASWLAFHLTPRFPGLRLAGGQRTAYLQTVVLNVLISLVPGISWEGHLGGFVSGFAAAYLLGQGRAGERVRGETPAGQMSRGP